MAQTLNLPTGTRDPDPNPDPRPGPNGPGTQTTQTFDTGSARTPDPDRADPAGPGPDGPESQQTRDPGPGPWTLNDKTATAEIHPGPTGPESRQTRDPGPRTPDPTLDFGWLRRRRIAAAARRRAIELAIARGVDAEMILREAEVLTDEDREPRALWERFAAGWPQMLLTILVAILASFGQVGFAREKGAVGHIKLGDFDLTPWFAPAVLDLSVAALFGRGMYVAVKHQGSPWLAWAAGAGIGAFSVWTNTQHERGAVLFAAASAVGLVSWMVSLIYKWWSLPHVKVRRGQRREQARQRRAHANPRLILSSLVFASWRTAVRGWVIARRRPVVRSAALISEEEQPITVRDLVIRAAELFNSVQADRRVYEIDKLGAAPDPKDKTAMKAWNQRRAQALERATLVAWDAVDGLLRMPTIDRKGIEVNQITYTEPAPAPQLLRRRSPSQQPTFEATVHQLDATEAVPAAPNPIASRRQAPALPSAERPGGNRWQNWLPMDEIVKAVPELGALELDGRCRCHPSDPARYCGESLAQHVQRKGTYVVQVLKATPQWWSAEAKIDKGTIRVIIQKPGAGLAMELGWVIGQLREAVAAVMTQPQDGSVQEQPAGA